MLPQYLNVELNYLFCFGMPSYIHSDCGSAFLSDELRSFLTKNVINSSFTTPYNPRGNGQTEKYNGIVWKAISLAVKSQNLKIEQWEQVLPVVLHSLRSLLCTATNTTPHERLFSFSRKSSYGASVPTFLSSPGPVLL